MAKRRFIKKNYYCIPKDLPDGRYEAVLKITSNKTLDGQLKTTRKLIVYIREIEGEE